MAVKLQKMFIPIYLNLFYLIKKATQIRVAFYTICHFLLLIMRDLLHWEWAGFFIKGL